MSFYRIVFLGLLFSLPVFAQTTAPPPDTIIFTDGEQLAGKLVSVIAGTVTFHSDVLGNVTVPLAKVKTLHTAQSFASVEKNQRITSKAARGSIPVGSVALENGAMRISPPQAQEKSIPAGSIGSLIDADSFHRELKGDSYFLYGWTGNITLGASLVKSTNSAQTYTGSVALVRSIPTIAGLPPISKTTLNLSGTYGLAKSDLVIIDGEVYQAASISKTDI